MDINKVKLQADEIMSQKQIINKYQDAAEDKFGQFFIISNESDSIWSAKMKEATNQFITDYKNYFEQNGFSITCGNPFGYNGTITEIEATYKEKRFKLSEINYDGEKMYFSDYDDINEKIHIALPSNIPNYFAWKDNIVIGDKRLIDMGGLPIDTFKDFIKKLNTAEELQELIEKIDINTLHFQDAISKADTVNLCIYRSKTDGTYQNFNEFIVAI